MSKKILFIICFLVSLSIIPYVKASAGTVDIASGNSANYAWIEFNGNNPHWYLVYSNTDTTLNFSGSNVTFSPYLYLRYSSQDSYNPEPPFMSGTINNEVSTTIFSDSTIYNVKKVYIMKGSFNINQNNSSIIVVDNTQSNTPWIIEAWDVFKDYMSGEPFHWIKSLRDFWAHRFPNLRGFWNNIFHKDSNGDIQQDMTIISPTPLPPTPTPITYSTFVEFDSNSGTYIYKYKYVDNNNVTIIATSPPEQPSSGSGSNENIKDDYYPEDPLDVPKDNGMWSPQFTINLGDGETLDIDLNTMNDTLIQGAEPYLDDIDASTDLFGAIPQDWFFLIGFCAIIPLICGIINRFLG